MSNRGRLVGPTLATACMLAVLLGLGSWQIKRLHWKDAILARLHQSALSAAIALPAQPTGYEKVWVSGVFRAGVTAHYGAEARDMPRDHSQYPQRLLGAHLLAVLDRPGAAPLLVDRGWVPVSAGMSLPPSGLVRVEGYVHPADHRNWMSATDMLAQHWFFTLDPARIGGGLGVPDLAPFSLIAMGANNGPPIPAAALPEPPNNHLSYAITWFSFALILLVIYIMWMVENWRGDVRKKASGGDVRIGPP